MQKCRPLSEYSLSPIAYCAMRHEGDRRQAFTLVEMLVVISIIAILIAISLPAVTATRAAAQKVECANNLKQLAAAILAYHTSHNRFPSGEVHGTSRDVGYSPWPGNSNHCSWDGRIGMWLNAIYPQLDMQNYYDQLNFDISPQYDDAANRKEMQRCYTLFHCPSDPLYNHLGNGWSRGGENAEPKNAAQILNYHGVMGSSMKSTRKHPDNTVANTDLKCNVSDGIFYNDSRVSSAWVRDGLGYTALIGEGLGRVYANGSPGSSPPLGYPATEKARGMNGMPYVCLDSPPNADDPDIPSGAHKIALADRGSPNRVRSFHRGGAHIALGDGTVRFINDYIESATRANSNPGVWQNLATIDGQDIVNPDLLNPN